MRPAEPWVGSCIKKALFTTSSGTQLVGKLLIPDGVGAILFLLQAIGCHSREHLHFLAWPCCQPRPAPFLLSIAANSASSNLEPIYLREGHIEQPSVRRLFLPRRFFREQVFLTSAFLPWTDRDEEGGRVDYRIPLNIASTPQLECIFEGQPIT